MQEIHDAIAKGEFRKVQCLIVEDSQNIPIKDRDGWTPSDSAIAWGKPEIAQFLWEKGGRPNFDLYRDGMKSPVHFAAYYGHYSSTKWAFEKCVLSPALFKTKDQMQWTPMGYALMGKHRDIPKLLRKIYQRLPVDPVFLAMQCAKRDHQCVLRRLPDELLDMVVDEVAARFGLGVEW